MVKQVRMLLKYLFCDRFSYKTNIWTEGKHVYEEKNIYVLFHWRDKEFFLFSQMRGYFCVRGQNTLEGLRSGQL